MGIGDKARAFWNAASAALGVDWQRCHCCLAPFRPENSAAMLCPDCRALLRPYVGPRCARCGLPLGAGALSGPAAKGLCGGCLIRLPPFGRCAYYGLYSGALRDLVLRFKFHNQSWLAVILGHFLAQASLCLPAPDALLAVPQHGSRLEKRGFNQAHELARAAARLGGWPLMSRGLRRHAPRPEQASLPASARKMNVAGIFRADPAIVGGKRLWLIDDVVTTGNTAAAASSALLAAGALEINVLCVARTARGFAQ